MDKTRYAQVNKFTKLNLNKNRWYDPCYRVLATSYIHMYPIKVHIYMHADIYMLTHAYAATKIHLPSHIYINSHPCSYNDSVASIPDQV